jgi:hypothetical protein
MIQLTQALTAVLLVTGVVAHPGGNTNREILRRQAHLDHPNRRSVQSCKRDLVESGWVREQHQRREARLHELRVAAGFAKEHEFVRRDVGEVEENYGVKAACTLDPESTEGPYCEHMKDEDSQARPLTSPRGYRGAHSSRSFDWREGCHHSPRRQHHRHFVLQARHRCLRRDVGK